MEPIKYLGYKRRDFLKLAGMTGAWFGLASFAPKGKEVEIFTFDSLEEGTEGLNHFIFIDKENTITIINHRPEMGQGVYQAMPMLIAEELEVDMDQIRVVQSGADGKKYGHQQVGGSSSVRNSWEPSRKLGATARTMLIQAAATEWGVSPAMCYAEKGHVVQRNSKKKMSYGALVDKAATLEAPKEVELKKKKEFKLLGTAAPRMDVQLKTNGSAVFSIDQEVEGMVYASVLRSPTFHGTVGSFNKEEIEQMPGVERVEVFETPVFNFKRTAIAVIASTYYQALKAKNALKVNWDNSSITLWNEKEILEEFNKKVEDKGVDLVNKGDFEANKNSENATVLESIYTCPYQAHACMEPLNATVSVVGDTCTFWGGIQSPNWIKSTLANYLSIPEKNVKMIISFLGGGFGRKAFTDFPLEAAILSKSIQKPVKVIWTREDDMQQGPFRPATVNKLTAVIQADNTVTGIQNKLACQDMGHQWPGADTSKVTQWILEGANPLYAIENTHFAMVPVALPIPVMWWRSVYASTNGFAHEAFIDEIASAVKQDPIEFRIEKFKEHPRVVAVLEKVRSVSKWGSKKKEEGLGVALVESFGSTCAQVVRVERNQQGKVGITKVTAVIDCGMIVNPDIIAQQIEGSIVMGLTAALKGQITFKDGQSVEQNFDRYKMLRIQESPEIEVVIMDNEEAPGGVGEPGLPPIAPALVNAIYDLTEKRIKTLPFNINEV